MAVSRLGAGARGPHVIDSPASWAFDAKIKGRSSCQHFVTVSASDFVVVCSLHFLMILGLRPRIRPDMRLRARHEHKQQAETLHDGVTSCGAVVRCQNTEPVGEGPVSPASAENLMLLRASQAGIAAAKARLRSSHGSGPCPRTAIRPRFCAASRACRPSTTASNGLKTSRRDTRPPRCL